MLEAITEYGPEGKSFKIFLQRIIVFYEDYGHLDDTQRVGRSGYEAGLQGTGWSVPLQEIQVSAAIWLALPLPSPGI